MDDVFGLQIFHPRCNLGRHKDEAADAENKLFTDYCRSSVALPQLIEANMFSRACPAFKTIQSVSKSESN